MGNNLPPQDVALIEKIKRAKALRDTYLPRRLTDEEFVELRKLEQELDPIDTKQFCLDLITKLQAALELAVRQRDAWIKWYSGNPSLAKKIINQDIQALLNGDVK